MTSEPIRDPRTDHLLTPENCVLAIIDYQPIQVQSVKSMPRDELVDNAVRVTRTAVTFDVPIVLSTVNVRSGLSKPTIPELTSVLPDAEPIDWTTVNSWEDTDFRSAIEATERKKIVMIALWTEVCLAFPLLDAMRQGFEAYPIVDAVGGTSEKAHLAGLERLMLASAQPVSWVQFAFELQRDWSRTATADAVRDIVFAKS
jgi:nicotinamidase-related amidase